MERGSVFFFGMALEFFSISMGVRRCARLVSDCRGKFSIQRV
jgi:hypothetical protein